MKETLLKVVGIEVISDKHTNKGKKVSFIGINIIGNREVQTNVVGFRNLWPDRTMPKLDGSGNITIKGDPTYPLVENGMFFAGSVQRFDTTPYELDGKSITSWKGVCFDHENALVVCARNLKANGAAPKDPETGEVFQLQTSTASAGSGVKKVDPILNDEPA